MQTLDARDLTPISIAGGDPILESSEDANLAPISTRSGDLILRSSEAGNLYLKGLKVDESGM